MKRGEDHIDSFVKMPSAGALLSAGIYPNTKEVTEAMAALRAVETYLRPASFNTKRRGVRVICVGDGSTPRCGALFAAETAWDTFSIDPALRVREYRFRGAERLRLIAEKSETSEHSIFSGAVPADRAIVIAIHSHAPLAETVRRVRANHVAVVAMTCCVPHDIARKPDVQYKDENVWSPERTVRIWFPRSA